MKNLIMYSSLLGVLFVLGACTVKTEPIPKVAENPTVNAGIKDALAQLGSVDNMTKWSLAYGSRITYIYYLTDTTYKYIYIILDPNNTNRIVQQFAEEGNLDKDSSDFPLYNRIDTTKLTDKKQYDKAYNFSATKSSGWTINTSKWEDAKPSAQHFIVKDNIPTELSMIRVDLKTPNTPLDGYKLTSPTMDTAILGNAIFTKQ